MGRQETIMSLKSVRRKINNILRKYGVKARIISVKYRHTPNVTIRQNLFEGKMKIESLGRLGEKARHHPRYSDLKRGMGDILRILPKLGFEYSFFYYDNDRWTLIIGANARFLRVSGRKVEYVLINIVLVIGRKEKENAKLELYGSVTRYYTLDAYRSKTFPEGFHSYSVKVRI